MKKRTSIIIGAIVVLLVSFLYYYINLPAINIHSQGFWTFLIVGLLIITAVVAIVNYDKENSNLQKKLTFSNKFPAIALTISGIAIVVFIIGYILSSPIVNADKYQRLLTVDESNFQEDITEISYSEIPVLDKESAIRLGSRKMGSIVEYVSQFEVADNYTQINYQGTPVRVTPLEYGGYAVY